MDLLRYWQRFALPALRARFGRSEQGANLVEYALLVGFIALVCILAVQFLGTEVSSKFSSVGPGIS